MKNVEDMRDAIKDIFGPMFEAMLQGEMNAHLGYESNDHGPKNMQNRPFKKFYSLLFVDCLYVSVRKEMETKNLAVYVILGYDVNGVKDILELWIGEAEGKLLLDADL